MKRKLLIIGFAFSLAINVGFFTAAAFHRQIREKMKYHHIKVQSLTFYLKKKFNLSESQVKVMEIVKDTVMSNIESTDKKLHKKKVELFILLKEPEPDRRKIDKKLREVTYLQGELRKIVFDNILKIKGILNAKQQEKLFSIISRKIDFTIHH